MTYLSDVIAAADGTQVPVLAVETALCIRALGPRGARLERILVLQVAAFRIMTHHVRPIITIVRVDTVLPSTAQELCFRPD